uniref:Uncharacterized protein n=1 Tax=Anguilla anguilla TaxID=7936 RepID=A0A0E9QH79_ANGAN
MEISFPRTLEPFLELRNLFQNSGTFSGTQETFPKLRNLFRNSRTFPGTQEPFLELRNFLWNLGTEALFSTGGTFLRYQELWGAAGYPLHC